MIAKVDGEFADVDLVVRLLRDHLERRLRSRLADVVEKVLSEVVDGALSSLQTDVQSYRDQLNLKDIFTVEVKVKNRV